MGMRHFDVQLIGGMALHDGQIAEMKTGEGKTLTATLAVVLNSLAVHDAQSGRARRAAGPQGRPRRDGQRLPRPPRRRMDEPDLRGARRQRRRAAEHAVLRGEAAGVRLRRRLRHQLGVRLRLPARQHGQGPLREGPARSLLRGRGRGRQHPHRRGPHAADHLRRPRTGRRPVRQVRETRAPHGRRRDPRRHGPAVQEAVHGGLRLRDRREAQNRLDHRAGCGQGREIPRHRPPLPRRERPPGQPPDPVAAGAGPVQARRRLRGHRRRGRDHRRVHRPHPRGQALVGGPAPGDRGQGGRARSRRRTRPSRRSPTRTTSASTRSSRA